MGKLSNAFGRMSMYLSKMDSSSKVGTSPAKTERTDDADCGDDLAADSTVPTATAGKKRVQDFKAVWVCRILACIGLYILFWSIPVCFWLAVILWIFSGKVELVNYIIGIKPEIIDTLVPFDQRKTILITGGSSTKG